MGDNGIGEIDDMPLSLAMPFFLLFLFSGLLIYSLFNIDASFKAKNQEDFQKTLSYALRSYTSSYKKDITNLSSLSEGYIIDEDIIIYGQNSNKLEIDTVKGSDYFFKTMELGTPFSKGKLTTNGVYIVNITTSFTPSEVYSVQIFRNGVDIMTPITDFTSLKSVQQFIESKLDVKIDIAENFNSSLRSAQRYAATIDKTGSNENVYSSYTTSMCIAKNVPISGVFGKELVDVHELQTYSIVRKDT